MLLIKALAQISVRTQVSKPQKSPALVAVGMYATGAAAHFKIGSVKGTEEQWFLAATNASGAAAEPAASCNSAGSDSTACSISASESASQSITHWILLEPAI